MRLLDRYIGRAVLGSALLVLLVLVALMSVIDFVVELGDVGTGRYGVLQALEYVVLTLPRRAYEMLPMAALIGSLAGLGALANSSELVVVRAAGVSVGRIAGSALKSALLLIVAAVLLGEWVAPAGEDLAQERRTAALAEAFSSKTRYGFWLRDGGRVINIRRVLPGATLDGVYLYQFDEGQRLREALSARSARFERGGWALIDVRLTRFEADGRALTQVLAEMPWRTTLDPKTVQIVSVEPERLSALGLYRYVRYLRDNGLESWRYETALWLKALNPLATALMVMLALPLVFGSVRAVSISQRVLLGTFLGIGFHILGRSLGYLGQVINLSPLLAAAAPLLAFALLTVALYRRLR